MKLENSATECCKLVDSSVLGKNSVWRRDNENENPDMTEVYEGPSGNGGGIFNHCKDEKQA